MNGKVQKGIACAMAWWVCSAPGSALPQAGRSVSTAPGSLPASGLSSCAPAVRDQATGGCLQASSTPAPGVLFPPPHDGGEGNTSSGLVAFVGGGRDNRADGAFAVVGGGAENMANADYGTIGGGALHQAGVGATVGGGILNIASGYSSTIPGGRLCEATDSHSFAAGHRARSLHPGSFVFSDSAFDGMESTGADQFLVDASGGMGVGTNDPGGAQLNVAGAIHSSGPTGGSFLMFNPNNAGASAHFSWKDDVARFRVGGNGPGANGGFDFQRIGDQSIMRLTDSRRVGIGTTAPAEKLQVIGNICATGTIGVCSDERFKTDVEPLEGALAKVLALRGVEYDWRRDEFPAHEFTDARQVGLIAQEVLQVVPEVVSEGGDGMYSVDYGKLTPVLVEAIREQQGALEVQRDEIARLREQLEELSARIGPEEAPR